MGQLKTYLVVNPHSANGDTGRRFERIRAAVRAAIGPFEHALTEAPMQAAALARSALARGFECVVAVGGDGTLNEVANGFFEGDRPVRPGAVLGHIPGGTGSDFRRTFGWGPSHEDAARRLLGDAARPLDLGRIEFVDAAGAPGARYFVNVASAGVSGRVDEEVNRATKRLGGRVSFALGSLKAMLHHRDPRLHLAVDGGEARELSATLVAVANGQYFGGGMWVAPGAAPDDGEFDLTVWSGLTLADFFLKAHLLYGGGHVRLPGTWRARAREVSLEAAGAESVLLDVDGEQVGRLPARFTIVPGAVLLKV